MNTAWCSDNDMHSCLENLDFVTDNGTSDASVDLYPNELSNLLDDEGNLLGELSGWGYNKSLGVYGWGVNQVQNWNSEATCFTGTRLGLELKGIII